MAGRAMRVVVVSGATRPLGALIHAANLAAALTADGIEVHRFAVADPANHLVDHDPSVTRVPAVDDDGNADSDALAAAIAAHLDGPVDVGHAEDPIAAEALFVLRELGRVRAVVVSVHHLEAASDVEAERRVQQSLSWADAVVCCSQWWADRVQREFTIAPLVIPNGVDVARFAGVPLDRHAAGRRFGWGDRPTILALGGVQPRKGSRVLLEAFARARARLGPDALLVIAGIGERREFHAVWQEDADRLGVRIATDPADLDGADVLELGVVANEDMPYLYRACDALVTPSTREGFGLVALEAAASGIPNVLSDLPVFAEHFSDEQSCLTVVAGDSGSLAFGIVRAVRETAVRERVIAGARTVVADLTWQDCARSYADVYARVLARSVG
jgi:glycosyltransferase involved in cell wall biosynthesis